MACNPTHHCLPQAAWRVFWLWWLAFTLPGGAGRDGLVITTALPLTVTAASFFCCSVCLLWYCCCCRSIVSCCCCRSCCCCCCYSFWRGCNYCIRCYCCCFSCCSCLWTGFFAAAAASVPAPSGAGLLMGMALHFMTRQPSFASPAYASAH
jgi:hypothetical protein